MAERADRWIVLGLGLPILVIGTGVAALLAWVLAGGLGALNTPYDAEDHPWSASEVLLPERSGELLFLRRQSGPSVRHQERRLRLVPAQAAPVELPVFDLGLAPVDVAVAWLPAHGAEGPGVLLEDARTSLVVDVERGMVRRLWTGHGRSWLVDVSGPGGDGRGEIQIDGETVRFVPVAGARVRDVTDDWPPADQVPLGRLVQDGARVRFQPATP